VAVKWAPPPIFINLELMAVALGHPAEKGARGRGRLWMRWCF